MHLLEKYSLNCGINPLKLDKPKIFSSYYPLPFEKYIVFNTNCEVPAKNYSYYQDVIDFIYEKFTKNGFGLVQIGNAQDKILNGCLSLNGKINIFQTSFILKNASLLVTSDGFSTHICSSYGIPFVSLYSTAPPEVIGPYWKNDKQFTIMTPLNGNKPVYFREDPQKQIDYIKPEEIIEKINFIFPALSEKNEAIETLFIGDNYKNKSIDIVPDSGQKITIPENIPVNIRFDLLKTQIKEENFDSAILNIYNKKFFITVSDSINIFKILNKDTAQNLISVILNLDDKNFSNIKNLQSFSQKVKSKGVPLNVFYNPRNLSEEQIGALKLEFLDITTISKIPIDESKESAFLNISSKINDLTFFKSSSTIISSGNLFSSEESYHQNLPSNGLPQKLNKIKNLQNLSKESNNLYIYNLYAKN
jgi:hypothetical protein